MLRCGLNGAIACISATPVSPDAPARETERAMNPSFERTLLDLWRQVLVENADVVELDGKRYPVRITPRKGLRQVDFMFDGNEIRGLAQRF